MEKRRIKGGKKTSSQLISSKEVKKVKIGNGFSISHKMPANSTVTRVVCRSAEKGPGYAYIGCVWFACGCEKNCCELWKKLLWHMSYEKAKSRLVKQLWLFGT